MTEYVELIKDDGGDYHLSPTPDDAMLRVTPAAWTKYVNAQAAMKAAAVQVEKTAKRPVFCTPEQLDALRSVAKPGAWIVVREVEQGAPPSAVHAAGENGRQDAGSSLSLVLPVELPPAAPARPRPGPCPQRGGLPHTCMRYAITDGYSEYDKGRIRIDGICQCGQRIPDVKCPHQKQELNENKQPACKWCRKVLVQGAGVIDNRTGEGIGGGQVDPNKPTPIPTGLRQGDDDPRIKFAYRAGE
jgi:hypothetical protein